MFLMPLAVGAVAVGVRRTADVLPLAAAQALVLLALRALVNVPG
jgi:hypothetical protein